MLSLWMGTAIVGRYVLIGPVGYGGVSVVYQAIDTHRGSRCAVKLLSPAFADDEYARGRVRQEALITTRLRHPSVPEVFDYGDATLPDGRLVPYVAMELLSGAMLAGRLAGGALPWPEAVKVAATIAEVCRACMAKRPEDRPVAAQVAIALWALVLDPADPAAVDQLSSEPPPVPRLPGLPDPRPAPEPLRPPGGSGTHRRAAKRSFAAVRPGPYSTGSG